MRIVCDLPRLRTVKSFLVRFETGPFLSRTMTPISTSRVETRIWGEPRHTDGNGRARHGSSTRRNYAEAEKMDRAVLDAERRVLGPEHSDTLLTMNNLAGVLGDEGRNAEAEKMFRELVEIQTRVLGADHPQTAESVYNVGVAEALQEHRNEALSFLRQALDHGPPAEGDLAIDADRDLKSLHGDPRFEAIVTDAKQRLAAQKLH